LWTLRQKAIERAGASNTGCFHILQTYSRDDYLQSLPLPESRLAEMSRVVRGKCAAPPSLTCLLEHHRGLNQLKLDASDMVPSHVTNA
jgi:predicted Zn-dependent protease